MQTFTQIDVRDYAIFELIRYIILQKKKKKTEWNFLDTRHISYFRVQQKREKHFHLTEPARLILHFAFTLEYV